LVHSTHSSYFYSSFYPTSLDISTLSLHYALPICLFRHLRLRFRPRLTARPCRPSQAHHQRNYRTDRSPRSEFHLPSLFALLPTLDRKSTRLNSSHLVISYAVFCLKKKIITNTTHQ